MLLLFNLKKIFQQLRHGDTQSSEPNEEQRRIKRLEECANCTHQKFDAKRGLVCALTDDYAAFDGECKKFDATEAYIAKLRYQQKEKQDEAENSFRRFLRILLIYLFMFCINVVSFKDEISRWAICILLSVGFVILAAAVAAYMRQRNQIKGEVLTNRKLKEIIRIEGYHIQNQETSGEDTFKKEGQIYQVHFDAPKLIIQYEVCIQGHVYQANRIAMQVMKRWMNVKIDVIERPENKENIVLLFHVETFVVHTVELQSLFSQYVHLIDYAVWDFGSFLNEVPLKHRESDIYFPEFRWLGGLVDAVCDGQTPIEALSDEAWIRKQIQASCSPQGAQAWESFRIERIIPLDEHKLIVYEFPQPKYAPEALYGAVLLHVSTHQAYYYTLEYSFGNKWVLGGTSHGKHRNYGETDKSDIAAFIYWVLDVSKKPVHITNFDDELSMN